MVSTAVSRRHALRLMAAESFGKPARPKQPHALSSLGKTQSAASKGSGGRGGFVSEEDSDLNLSFVASSADLKSLGLGRDVLAGIAGGGSTMGHGGGMSSMDEDDRSILKAQGSLGGGHRRRRKRGRGDPKFHAELGDARKLVCTLAGTNPLSPLPGKALVETGSFLGTSISIFPMSVTEEMVLEAKDMALKLRQIHDALQGEVKQKVKRLVDIKRGVEERNSQDAYTMSRTMAGESMIKALDTRLTRVRSTSVELERVGAFYSRIIELCVSNPPKDNRHLRALEEQVFLSKQQTTDLSGKVQDLFLQKDQIERLGIDSLRAQLARTKAVRKKACMDLEELLREQIEKSVRSERRGLKASKTVLCLEELSSLPRGSTERAHPSIHGVGVAAVVATGTSSSGGEKRDHSQFCLDEEQFEAEGKEEALERLAILVGAEHIDDVAYKFKDVEARSQDLQAQGQSSALAVEALRKELEESRRVLSDLQTGRGRLAAADGAATGGATPTSGNANLHREQRRLDDLVFQSGIRLAQSTRKAVKAKEEFNDLRVGILHLATLIDSVVRQTDDCCGGDSGGLVPAKTRVQKLKAKALSGAAEPVAIDCSAGGPATGAAAAPVVVPAATAAIAIAPEDYIPLKILPAREFEDQMEFDDETDNSDGSGLVDTICVDKVEDICKLLKACETRICRVMEVCGLGGEEETDCSPEGSAAHSAGEATVQSHSFWHSGLNTSVYRPGSDPVMEGAATPSVLQRLFMGRNKGLKGDGAGMDIRVFPLKARDSRFERSMGDALRQQNEELEMQETEANNLDRNAVATGVASFLEDALNGKLANKHLRRANMLVMGKQGKRAGFGLVMDNVLSGADIDIYGLADATRRRANGMGKALNADGAILSRTDLSTAVRARPDLKASSHATSSRRKHEDRKKSLMKKRVAQRA
ncbi:unnamed protein product [Pylaiella littoralis]